MNIKEEIIGCISKVGKISKDELDLDTQIFDSNIVTSLGLLEIVSFIEKQYNLIITPEELIHENFGSIRMIVDFINKKCA